MAIVYMFKKGGGCFPTPAGGGSTLQGVLFKKGGGCFSTPVGDGSTLQGTPASDGRVLRQKGKTISV